MDTLKPRLDVGTAGISGAVAVVVMMILERGSYFDFNQLTAALAVLFVAGAGWLLPGRVKSLAMAAAGFVAIIVASLVQLVLTGDYDHLVLSTAVGGLVAAFYGYKSEPVDPDAFEGETGRLGLAEFARSNSASRAIPRERDDGL